MLHSLPAKCDSPVLSKWSPGFFHNLNPSQMSTYNDAQDKYGVVFWRINCFSACSPFVLGIVKTAESHAFFTCSVWVQFAPVYVKCRIHLCVCAVLESFSINLLKSSAYSFSYFRLFWSTLCSRSRQKKCVQKLIMCFRYSGCVGIKP